MKQAGLVLIAVGVGFLLMAGVLTAVMKPTGDPARDTAEMLGRFTCPAVLLFPGIVLFVIGSRKKPNASDRERSRRGSRSKRERDDYE
jgi:hypothetical protein